ncbi:MAG: UvrD-helicase domain-containing protein [Ignavibacteria bacterium]|jgi:DNA helicase-2/ATP-dependent DNA helicase PcrA|nr:UvrD-helicase domain-containing protein [Ignavibacteria bacterium]MCU7498708.1 UvrD-helicase domain-containing protein [Ignavibacteria bacterium]MCU7512097.1 UvrD-helicase domain-containing protein [Ignavibacteria bacterium]MCU7520630.1 UvrD-helicase domain-containing protein [Ignavibacteria bacterium]MCU7523528.1 UvrD-helicase domain-containing protein [Ignavibacteria bacterium]
MTLLKTLNLEQKEAVEYLDGPQMIVAGAGSGKTRVLTYKIAYLIDQGFEPSSILALTFTNKAANEMKQRIRSLIGESANHLWMGTFHSIFAKILRIEAEKINFKSNFSIYDTEDSSALVSTILQEMNWMMEGVTANSIHHKISFLKNQMIYPKEYADNIASSVLERKIADIYEEFNKRLHENNSMDFDDLLLKPIELFKEKEKVLQKYKKKFTYILVDEYQDTNRAQYELLRLLVSSKRNICVVGDDAQSIYGWRGADIRNMLDFERDFPKAKIFRLEQNYRSTKTILAAAGSVIKNNQEQIAKTLWTENNDGEELALVRCSDEKDEAYQLTKLIKEEISQKKLSYKDFAILYRINSQSRALEDAFRRERIPYRIIGGIEFYKRKEVKDVIAYLRVLANQADEESLLRIMNFPQRGIGNTSISKMIAFARKHHLTLFDTMMRVFEVIEVKERIQKNVKAFKLLLDKYITLNEKLSLSELISALIDELGILRVYKEENTPESLVRYENIQELLNAISDYSKSVPNATMEQYLAEVSLVSGVDQMEDENNSVTMMTVHSAKGLEFPVVFVSGLEEDIFPLAPKFNSDARIEEERRLFYVALTRAQSKVFLTYARSRYRFGEVAYQSKSRFIEELDPATYVELNGAAGRKGSSRRTKKDFMYDEHYQEDYDDFNQEQKSLRMGSKVMHEKFGLGKVQQINGIGEMQRVTVAFEEAGVKQLLVKFAKLKVL